MMRASVVKRLFSDKLFKHVETSYNSPTITFEFTQGNKTKVQEILSKYPEQYKKAAIIPLLHLGQEQLGWTSISVMNHVAKIVQVPPMRVYEVATFYTMFNREPVGKYFLQVCTTTPCQLCNAEDILETIKSHLGIQVGQTTKDNLFTLVEVECAGACVNAPVMAVNNDYYEDLTKESTVAILESLKKGKVPKMGPQSERKAAEPKHAMTSLVGPPTGPGFGVRSDL